MRDSQAHLGVETRPRGRGPIVIAWLFAAIVVCLLAFTYFSIRVMAAGRAYVGGESYWSKAQKEAVHTLSLYAQTHDQADYQAYLSALKVIQGDHKARVALEQPEPDRTAAFEGFVQGHIHPDDIDGMIWMFIYFGNMSPVDKALNAWREADDKIEHLLAMGERIHAGIQRGSFGVRDARDAADELKRMDLVFAALEDEYARALGDALRYTQNLLLIAMFAIATVMLAGAFAFARRTVKEGEHLESALRDGERQLRRVLQFTPLSIIVVRVVDEVIVYANERALKQLALTPETLAHWPTRNFYVRAEDRGEVLKAMHDFDSVRDWEVQLQDSQGNAFWALVSSQRIVYRGEDCLLTALHNIDDRKRAQDDLRRRAFHDELTGLPNRAMFLEALRRAIARMQRNEGQLSIMFIDLDRFKVVNDTLGHDVGDRLLQQVAQRMRASVRDGDLVARLGGDEFVVLVEGHRDPSAVALVAQNLLKVLEPGYVLDEREISVTSSIGISNYPEDGATLHELVKHADIAMYQAKAQGRNNFQFYTASQNQLTLRRLDLEARLGHALDRDEFVLHYQPVIDLRQRALIGVEALIRWNDPLHGQLAPGEFIPLAEDTGAIVAIGHWVLQAAAAQVQAWNQQLARPLTVAVNISPRQFSNHNFLADLHQVLQASGLAPSALHLEITETMVMQQHALSESILKRLGALGVSVAIDDFGTGYSSLSQLKSIPAEFIKIDRSFIMDCATDPQARAIVHAIIVMAHSLKMKVVAEGVEEADQLRVLTEMGCDHAQGYFFGRPVDPQTMHAMAHDDDWLRERFECAVH